MYSYIIEKESAKKAEIPIDTTSYIMDHEDWEVLRDIHINNIEPIASKPNNFFESLMYILGETQWYDKSKTVLSDEGSSLIVKNIGIKYLRKHWVNYNYNYNFITNNYFSVNLYKYSCTGEKTKQIFPVESKNSNTFNPSFHIYFFIRKDNQITGGDFKIMNLVKNSNGLSYHQKIHHIVKSTQARCVIVGPDINYKVTDFEGNGDCDVILLDIEVNSKQ